MKKTIYIILILVSLFMFSGLIYIAINAKELSNFISSVGFILLGYISIVIFVYAWFKIKKS